MSEINSFVLMSEIVFVTCLLVGFLLFTCQVVQ